MCVVDKCCFIVPLNLGSLVIGLVSLISSICWTLTAGVLLVLEIDYQKEWSQVSALAQTPHTHILKLNLNNESIDTMLFFALLLGLVSIFTSAVLIVGLQRNKPNLVLMYFGFATMLTILGQLSGLLLLLSNMWACALVVFLIFCIQAHFLVVVHTIYEQMLKGHRFGFCRHIAMDEAPILEDII